MRQFEADELIHIIYLGLYVRDVLRKDLPPRLRDLLFAHLVQYVEVLLVQHVFVEHERQVAPRKPLPEHHGLRRGQKAAEHERARVQARAFAFQTKGVGVFEERYFAVGGKELIHTVLVLVRAHRALHQLAHVLFHVAVEPFVHKRARRLRMFAHVGADQADEVVQVHDVGHLYRGHDVGIFPIGLLHADEHGLLLGRQVKLHAVEVVQEARRLELAAPLVNRGVLAGERYFVALADAQAVGVHERFILHSDAVLLQVQEGRDTVAAAGRHHVDGGGRHARDGVHLAQHNRVFGQEPFFAEADFLALAFQFQGYGRVEAEFGRHRRAGQHVYAFREEDERLQRAVVDALRENLPPVVRAHEFAHAPFADHAGFVQRHRRQQRRSAGQLALVDLQYGKQVGLALTALRAELNRDGRAQPFFQFGQQRVEVIHGRKRLLDLRAVEVFAVLGREVAGHDFLAEDIGITLYLHAEPRAGVAAVQHARVRRLAADCPHHLLQDQRGVGRPSLHKRHEQVLVVPVEVLYIFKIGVQLFEGIVQIAFSVGMPFNEPFRFGNPLLAAFYGGLPFLFARRAAVPRYFFGLRLRFVGGGLVEQHLVKPGQVVPVDARGHLGAVVAQQPPVGRAVRAHVEQRGHEAGYILRHRAAQGHNQRGGRCTEPAARHNFEVADGLSEISTLARFLFGPLRRLRVGEAGGLFKHLGRKQAEVGHGVARARQVGQHHALVAYFVNVVCLGRQGGGYVFRVDERVIRHIGAALFVKLTADGLQPLHGCGLAARFQNQQFEKLLGLRAAVPQHKIDIVPARRDFGGLGRVFRPAVYNRTGLVAFRLAVFLELPCALLHKEVEHKVVRITPPDFIGYFLVHAQTVLVAVSFGRGDEVGVHP